MQYTPTKATSARLKGLSGIPKSLSKPAAKGDRTIIRLQAGSRRRLTLMVGITVFLLPFTAVIQFWMDTSKYIIHQNEQPLAISRQLHYGSSPQP